MNNLNSQQLAELLARKCAEDWHGRPLESITFLAVHILQSIPLVELLELYKEANERCCRHTSDINGKDCPTCVAINNLNLKLTQIL